MCRILVSISFVYIDIPVHTDRMDFKIISFVVYFYTLIKLFSHFSQHNSINIFQHDCGCFQRSCNGLIVSEFQKPVSIYSDFIKAARNGPFPFGFSTWDVSLKANGCLTHQRSYKKSSYANIYLACSHSRLYSKNSSW